MIQRLGYFIHKWGYLISVAIGVILIISTIGLDIRGVTEVEYYDESRSHTVLPMPIEANYFVGVLIISFGIKKEWISELPVQLGKS
ncbi:hypothetical protein SAMN05661012_06720 [Chitinophaga sancti]|uniref:Uncharacterized protein n=1 Tax=Chitinophaga sancti TaxID=1004 RepID=A0A1K1T3G1_9BACT|nr:hypothetical protein SAMN05661012_06720 [Chitinophaga sancti]